MPSGAAVCRNERIVKKKPHAKKEVNQIYVGLKE
jgi:hypothetical protein